MAKKDFTKTSKFLLYLLASGEALSYIIGTPYTLRRSWEGRNYDFRYVAYALARRGIIKIVDKNNERFIKLTNKGQLEALFAKAQIFERPKLWDGKWRIVIFDIPEGSKDKRELLRRLLRKHGFRKLQISVYVSPHPLSRDAIRYLKKSKMIKYIRIAKIEEFDDDTKLRKLFSLPAYWKQC